MLRSCDQDPPSFAEAEEDAIEAPAFQVQSDDKHETIGGRYSCSPFAAWRRTRGGGYGATAIVRFGAAIEQVLRSEIAELRRFIQQFEMARSVIQSMRSSRPGALHCLDQ